MQTKYRYLFGPVPSRRLGRSLGVDLTPYKTCCQDCVFCQLGRTTNKTVERKEYVDTKAVLTEFDHWLETNGEADYITLSGSGEPTLQSHFGEVLEFVGSHSKIPTVLLTNGALFHLPEVRKSASRADIVKVSLSAWHQSSFEWVNRPHVSLGFKQLIDGQMAFRAEFKGQLWMEVFMVRDMNTDHRHVKRIAELANMISPDRVHLNTAVRPPSEDFVAPLSSERLSALTHMFHPKAEIIAEFSAPLKNHVQANQDMIFAMLQRRPCTSKQIADVFDMNQNEVLKYLDILMRANQIRAEIKSPALYYFAVT